jgi:signal transduction histidine kinase
MGEFKTQIESDRNDEIGELCDAVNYMASELDRAENLKNDFISSVSHELRTPLTAIRGWGETAKMSIGFDDSLVEKGLDVVLNESERLSKLVEELLDFSRMQSGRLTVNVNKLNVTKLIFAAADMYVELAKQRNIEVVSVPPKNDCEILGDADRLKQVFVNIIDNAVKYTESGGQVLIEQYVEETHVRIVVKDTGVGIPAADIDRVKEKFFKSNKTVRGSGIGLAVADEIVKQHQGLLFIESTEGVGTTVTVVFPLCESEREIPLEPGKIETAEETLTNTEEQANEQM